MSVIDVTVIILTYQEEVNVGQAIASVAGWARDVFVLDSFSTDATVDIARAAGARVFQHPFADFSQQRNHALDALPIVTEWALFLDADEWVTAELRAEIAEVVAAAPREDGFYVNRRFLWNGTWIRRGYYPSWILRLFRYGRARCEAREVNEHLLVEGAVGRLRHDLVHEDRKGLHDWIAKHNGYAEREARLLLAGRDAADDLPARLVGGTQAERKRWLRVRVWNRLPPLVRPFLYFFYRYVLAGGFLDGRNAFIFHFLQALWLQFLIDAKYLELRRARSAAPARDGLTQTTPSPVP